MEVSGMDIEHWTVEVCEGCGKVHRSRRLSCVVEYNPAGDTFAGTRTVEVVPRSGLEGAVDESRMLRRILQATQEYLLLAPDDSVDYDALLTRVRSALGGR